MATASRRALTILRLFEGDHAGWRVNHASFGMRSVVRHDGLRWKASRSIEVSDAGIWSMVSVSPSCGLTSRQREKVLGDFWQRLHERMSAAGFEDRCTIDPRFTHAFFIRRIPSTAAVGDEWRHLRDVSVARVVRGGTVPARRKPPQADVRDVAGRADRLYATLRRDAALMAHLDRLAYERTVREAVGEERWIGALRLMGDPFCIQAIAQFRLAGVVGEMGYSRTYARVCKVMKRHGYDAVRRIAFSKANLGRASLGSEKAFLEGLRIRDLVRM